MIDEKKIREQLNNTADDVDLPPLVMDERSFAATKTHKMNNKPENIIAEYQRELLSVSSDNLYKLVNDLRNEKNTHSAFLFGHSVHLTRKDRQASAKQVIKYLQDKGHENIHINVIKPGIEDCFMDLMHEENEI